MARRSTKAGPKPVRRPHPPGWVNRPAGWIDRAPGSALIIFDRPLWGAHRMVAAVKTQALTANGEGFKAVTAKMRGRLDGNRIAGMDETSRALAGLDQERTRLALDPGDVPGRACRPFHADHDQADPLFSRQGARLSRHLAWIFMETKHGAK